MAPKMGISKKLKSIEYIPKCFNSESKESLFVASLDVELLT